MPHWRKVDYFQAVTVSNLIYADKFKNTTNNSDNNTVKNFEYNADYNINADSHTANIVNISVKNIKGNILGMRLILLI